MPLSKKNGGMESCFFEFGFAINYSNSISVQNNLIEKFKRLLILFMRKSDNLLFDFRIVYNPLFVQEIHHQLLVF